MTTAETQVETTRAQLISVGVQRAQFEHAIAMLIGRPPANVDIPSAPLARRIPVVPPSVPSALLERRPDIAAAERRISSMNALIGVAVAAYFPDLSLSGGFGSGLLSYATYGYVGSKAFPIAVANEVWSVGGNLAEVIFDAGLRREQVGAALASYYQSVGVYRQTVLTALQQVEDRLSNLRILALQARALDKAVRSAREALKITSSQYEAGTVDYTAVVQAQEVLLSNEVNGSNRSAEPVPRQRQSHPSPRWGMGCILAADRGPHQALEDVRKRPPALARTARSADAALPLTFRAEQVPAPRCNETCGGV